MIDPNKIRKVRARCNLRRKKRLIIKGNNGANPKESQRALEPDSTFGRLKRRARDSPKHETFWTTQHSSFQQDGEKKMWSGDVTGLLPRRQKSAKLSAFFSFVLFISMGHTVILCFLFASSVMN